jgi:nucleolar complex protein 2
VVVPAFKNKCVTMVKIKKQSNVEPKKKLVKVKKRPISKPQKKNKIKVKKSKKNDDFSSMSVDNFLDQDFEGSVSEESEQIDEEEVSQLHSDIEENVAGDNIEDNESEDEIENHKKALSKLQDTDPEFYNFLQENDKKLLDFDVSDDDVDDDEEDPQHKPSEELEVASDESDFEDDQVKDKGIVTLKMLKNWDTAIQKDLTNKTILSLTRAFHAALVRVSSENEQEPCQYKVEGSAVFNGVIQLCVIHLGPALRRFLRLKEGSKQPPHKCKRFIKIKRTLKDYFMDLSKVIGPQVFILKNATIDFSY